jgi:sugar phosphate permease
VIWKHRYSVLSILFCSYLLCYLDRMIMATAIPFIARDFQLSPLAMGGVLSAFFVGYALMQIPGGLLSDRFGPRAVLTGSILWWSVLTAVTGAVPGLTTMLIVRLLFGLGEGPFPSAASKAVSAWFPVAEVGRANGVQLASTAIGAAVAPLFVVTMIVTWGWREVFYALFLPGVVLAAIVWHFIRNTPAESARVTSSELLDYETGEAPDAASSGPAFQGSETSPTSTRRALAEALRTPSVLWSATCLLFSNVLGWGLLTWLPTYLLRARGFSLEKMGVLTALTAVAFSLALPLGGHICDKYLKRDLRIQIIIGVLGGASMTALAAIASSGELAVVFFMLALLFVGVGNIAMFTLPLIVMPKHAVGSAFGIVNTAGQIAGAVSPLLVGLLLDTTGGDFKIVLLSLAGIAALAAYPASRIRMR